MYAIRRETDYALRAIAVMVSHRENGRALSTSALAELCASSVDMMRKVMSKLAGAGIVKSSRGRNGGFMLARRPERISLADIIAAVQGPLLLNTCVAGPAACDYESRCPIAAEVRSLQKSLERLLSAATFAGLDNRHGRTKQLRRNK